MFSKTKIALTAIVFLGSASAAMAQSADEHWTGLRDPNAPVATYQQPAQQPMARLIEGRNVQTRNVQSRSGTCHSDRNLLGTGRETVCY